MTNIEVYTIVLYASSQLDLITLSVVWIAWFIVTVLCTVDVWCNTSLNSILFKYTELHRVVTAYYALRLCNLVKSEYHTKNTILNQWNKTWFLFFCFGNKHTLEHSVEWIIGKFHNSRSVNLVKRSTHILWVEQADEQSYRWILINKRVFYKMSTII